MRENSRIRKALRLILLLVVPAIDQVFGASLKVDGDKGQPEMVQPLDNHPLEWTIDDESDSAEAKVSDNYRYPLMQRTDDLLSEALDMLARVKDGHSRRWLEAFIYKMGEIAVQLGGKHYQRKAKSSTTPPQVLPTPHPAQAKVTSLKNASEHQVTSTQLNNVLPVNEVIVDRQVVTRPGFADHDLEEDELVRQLHDQERFRNKETDDKMKAADDYPTEASQLLESVQSEIHHLAVKDDEKQLLMDLAKELNELSDLEGAEQSLKGNHDRADLKDVQIFQHNDKLEKNEAEFQDRPNSKSSYKLAKQSNLYFKGTSPKMYQTDNQSVQGDGTMLLQKMKPEDVKQNSGSPEKFNQSPKLSVHPHLFQSQAVNNLSDDSNDQAFKSTKNQFPHKNYMYNFEVNKFTGTKQNDRFQKKNLLQQQPSQDFSKASEKPQSKVRHPMLQDMLLAKHGHNGPHLHLHPQKNIMDVYDSSTDIKIHNVTVSEPTKVHANQHTFSQPGDPKKQSSIYKQKKSHPFQRSVLRDNQNQQRDTIHREGDSSNMGDFHFDQIPFPNQLESNSQLHHKMERQLRAGKVVILSDSLVKANFNKNAIKANATKTKENHGNSLQPYDALVYKNGYPN